MTPAIGVLNVAAGVPAPAPQASKTLRSAAVVETNWPMFKPEKAPAGLNTCPSALKGRRCQRSRWPPRMGLRITTFASDAALGREHRASIASGMPCPLIFGEPYLAMYPTIIPPMTGMTITHGPSW